MFTKIYRALTEFFYRLYLTFVDALQDLFFWCIESVCNAVTFVLSSVFSLFNQIDASQYMGSIPPTVSWVFIQIGVPNALIIISSALVTRMMLQLIPFTRLGS